MCNRLIIQLSINTEHLAFIKSTLFQYVKELEVTAYRCLGKRKLYQKTTMQASAILLIKIIADQYSAKIKRQKNQDIQKNYM